jgi:hypothetical protein
MVLEERMVVAVVAIARNEKMGITASQFKKKS